MSTHTVSAPEAVAHMVLHCVSFVNAGFWGELLCRCCWQWLCQVVDSFVVSRLFRPSAIQQSLFCSELMRGTLIGILSKHDGSTIFDQAWDGSLKPREHT